MNPQQLKYFVAVAQRGSLSKASEAVGLSQPALSRQIANLEAQAHRKLFVRTPNGMALTPAGRALLAGAEELLESIDRIKRDVMTQDDMYPHALRIGLPQSSWEGILAIAVAALMKDVPTVRLEIDLDSSGQLREKLQTSRLDMAIMSAFVPATGLKTMPLLTEQMYLVGPFSSQLDPEKAVSPSEVSQYALISRGGPIEPAFASMRAADRIEEYRVIADCKSEEACIGLIENGVGYSLMSALHAHKEYKVGRISIAPVEGLYNTWAVATKNGSHRSVLVDMAINHILTATRNFVGQGQWPTAKLRF